jgi:hypothetical protein
VGSRCFRDLGAVFAEKGAGKHEDHLRAPVGQRPERRRKIVRRLFQLALAHALRIYMDWPVMIAHWSVPKSVSWIALIVAGGFALVAFRFAASDDN